MTPTRQPRTSSSPVSTATSSAGRPAAALISTRSISGPATETSGRTALRVSSASLVLSLLLAEAEVLAGYVGVPPLLLLDDALSELDASRRRILSDRLGRGGQAIVTATGPEALPLAPAQLLVVEQGEVKTG